MPRWMPFSGAAPSTLDADEVPGAISKAEAALAADDSLTALEWMRAASAARELPTQERDRVQVLLERAANRRIEVLATEPGGAEELADLVDLDLPRQIAVQAGMRSAELMVADGESLDAYAVLKRLDTKFPLHYERQRAGDMMCDIGLVAIQDGPGFMGWFSTQDEGQEILEYVILNAPWARRCDEAYRALSDVYEKDREWDLAIDRAQKLVLNHPASPLRVEAQARVPHMRLASIKSPEYDRSQILIARDELQVWLLAYANRSELESAVRVDLGDALRRLSDNDLIVSRFYHRVDNVFGARSHAERAVAEAREAGDDERVAKAERWLAELPLAPPAESAAPALAPGAKP